VRLDLSLSIGLCRHASNKVMVTERAVPPRRRQQTGVPVTQVSQCTATVVWSTMLSVLCAGLMLQLCEMNW
jgi:hypothetical protein